MKCYKCKRIWDTTDKPTNELFLCAYCAKDMYPDKVEAEVIGEDRMTT